VSQKHANTALITIIGARQMDVSRCRLESTYHEAMNIVETLRITNWQDLLYAGSLERTIAKNLFTGGAATLRTVANRYRTHARTLGDEDRARLETTIASFETDAAEKIASIAPADARDETPAAVPIVATVATAVARLFFAPALVIADRPYLTLSDNLVIGDIRLYGNTTAFGPEEFVGFARRIGGGAANTDPVVQDARFSGNRMTSIVVDSSAEQLLDGERIRNVFARWSLLDNTFYSPGNQLLATHIVASANQFQARTDAWVAAALASHMIVTANTAVPSAQFRWRAFRKVESANLMNLNDL
jgi:hypothetical protein